MIRTPGSPSLLIVGCGDLGAAVGTQLIATGWQVWGLRRRPESLPAGITPVTGDVTTPDTLAAAAGLRPDLVLVTLTPAAFDDPGYRQTYVAGARHLLQVLPRPQRLLWVSSTSVYPQDDGSWVNEQTPCKPASFSGQRLLEAEILLQQSGWPVTVVRLAGIYGPGRDRLLLRLQAGRRSPPTPVRISNRIHRDDAAGVLRLLLERAASGEALDSLYLGVDCEPTPIHEVEQWFADWLRLPPPPAAPTAAPLRGGHRYCSNARLRALGYRFLYPSFRDGLPTLLKH
ncbi:MAG: SDR family oxidoreductase [Spongiibacteraceae bacterium]|nr:SDR family oxidoreductase [Spongiibacteraceae bacterium]